MKTEYPLTMMKKEATTTEIIISRLKLLVRMCAAGIRVRDQQRITKTLDPVKSTGEYK